MGPTVRQFVDPGSVRMTDEFGVYNRFGSDYMHKAVNHLEKYVDGTVHTKGIENFWSLLKRQLGGTYVSVEPFHLFRYVDEQAFRFNTRKDENGAKISDAARFAEAMSRVNGHRLTYSQLTVKDQSPRHETTVAGETPIPFLVLAGKTRFLCIPGTSRCVPLALLLLGPYNYIFGNFEEGLHAFFKVLSC